MRDYVYGLSNDPVRAAITTDLAATGVGGVLDSATTYWTSWRQARHNKPAETKFIGNNHLRLYRDANTNRGELVAEVEGLGDFTIHGPTVSIAKNPFQLSLMEGPAELKVTEVVAHRYLEHAGHVAKLEEKAHIDNRYLDLAIEETRRYEMLSDSPYVTVRIDRKTTFPEDGNQGFIQAYKNVCFSFDVPGYDRISQGDREESGEFSLEDETCLVLEDVSGVLPPFFVALVESSGRGMEARLTADGKLRLFCAPEENQRFVFRFGVVTSWLTQEHLTGLSMKDGFSREAEIDTGGGVIKNDVAVPAVRKVRIRSAGQKPYLVCERGFWTWRGAQPSRETPGDDLLKVYLDAGAEATIIPEGFIDDAIKPAWGSQYQLAISENVRKTSDTVEAEVWVRSVSAAIFAPRLRFKEKLASVTLDGAPWLYLDDDVVFLPNRQGKYQLSVRFGEAASPSLLSSWGVPRDFAWDGERLSFSLDLPPFTYRLPRSVYLYGALRTPGMRLAPQNGVEMVRQTPQGLVFRCKPGHVAFACADGR